MNFLNNMEKHILAIFLKRITFDMAYECAGCGSREEMKADAYRTLAVVEKVQNELAAQGFAPR